MNLNAANNINMDSITVKAQLITKEDLLRAAERVLSNKSSLTAIKELKAA